jgi:hypothetical protein
MREIQPRPRGVMARLRRLDGMARVLGASLAAVLLVGSGCGPVASGGGTVAPGGNGNVRDGADPEGREEGDNNVDDLRVRLERLTREQDDRSSSSDGSFGACEDLCSLASSICTVKEKLCEVADRHPGEEEYQGLCRKADLECSESEDSCVACVEARESREAAAASQ